MTELYDVVIIGGGINGCGCAADAALRGLSVLLCEKDDLAANTSSKSTKLIHGGLRYLEHYDFLMVKKALIEREHLLNLAPHLVKPLELVIPYLKHMRPSWMLRTGLFIYDNLSLKNTLPKSHKVTRRQEIHYFSPLNEKITSGFLFYDGTTDDTRLTLSNALQAQKHGAKILTHSLVKEASVHNRRWHLTIQRQDGSSFKVYANSVVNASGPWVKSVSELLDTPMHKSMSLVKGSHIVVPKLYEGSHAYFLQHDDKRMIFVIPYHEHTMIGTTDVEFNGDLDQVEISKDESDYLCRLVNEYFQKSLSPRDIINSWSGVRPLIGEAEGKKLQKISRDYSYHFDILPAPVVTIYGGKITTYRQLAAETISSLHRVFPNLPPSCTLKQPLPGAVYGRKAFSLYQDLIKQRFAWLNQPTLNRYLQLYGTLTEVILAKCSSEKDLGQEFGPTLYQVEVDYLVQEEWATCSEDILWRRTKLGLVLNNDEVNRLSQYVKNKFDG